MPRVLAVDGSVKIGAYRFPDRKKPYLCVEKGNVCTVYVDVFPLRNRGLRGLLLCRLRERNSERGIGK